MTAMPFMDVIIVNSSNKVIQKDLFFLLYKKLFIKFVIFHDVMFDVNTTCKVPFISCDKSLFFKYVSEVRYMFSLGVEKTTDSSANTGFPLCYLMLCYIYFELLLINHYCQRISISDILLKYSKYNINKDLILDFSNIDLFVSLYADIVKSIESLLDFFIKS